MESIAIATLNILETVRLVNPSIRVYNAGSSECFGDTGEEPATENTAFRPRSPYGVAKTAACNLVTNYREAYHLHCSSGILFNHESPLRPRRFVTKKIASAAARIAAGAKERLSLGNLAIERDWGWAPEYVEAMWMMLQQDNGDDFVIATGATHSLEEFVAAAFAEADLNWRDHVAIDPALVRPAEIITSRGNAAKAERILGWKAGVRFADVVRRLVAFERESLAPHLMSVRRKIARLKPAVHFVTALAHKARAAAGLGPQRPPVGIVIERADWAIRWYGTFVAEGANAVAPGTAWVTTEPAILTQGIVEFGSQYQWVDWSRHLSPRCRFVSTFFHGKPEDGPEVARHIDRFMAALPRLDKVICSASIVRDRLMAWGAPPGKLALIPIGCETDRFLPPTEEQRSGSAPAFRCAARRHCGWLLSKGRRWLGGGQCSQVD